MAKRERALPNLGGLGDQYEIVRELGRGGTAVVYLGRDKELERDVAIKVIRSTFVEDEEAMARLVREARTVAGLQHPNIVMLYGTKKLEDNSLALIMQYVPGRSLKDLIRAQGPLTCAQAGHVLVDVGRALSYAHRRRIVHRDIKPENIYVDEEADAARLSDFGIARPWDTDSNLTLPGMALGTPAYMSPEQIDGRDLDGRSDVYSLGLVGYEMLTGRQPWAGENLYTVIYRQKHDELPSLADLRPDMPPHLRRAIEVALKKNRVDRWASASDFLQQVQAGPLPATPPPPALQEQSEKAGEDDVSEEADTIMYRRLKTDGDEVEAEQTTVGPPPLPEVATARVATSFTGRATTVATKGKPRRGRTVLFALAGIVAVTGTVFGLSQIGLIGADPSGIGTVAVSGSGDDATSTGPVGTQADPGTVVDTGGGPTDSSTLTNGAGPTGPVPAVVHAFSGDAQSADPGSRVQNPLVVRVEDVAGAPLAGVTVHFSVATGGGLLLPDSVVTDAAGLASAQWMLGRSDGVQEARASVFGLDGPVAVFTANLEPVTIPLERITLLGGDGQQASMGATLPEPVVMRVEDAEGSPAAGVTVRFQVTGGGGSVSPTEMVTNGAGQVETFWTLGFGARSNTLQIVAEGLEDRPADVSASGVPRPLAIRRAIVAGATHTCATTVDGTPYCWGGNENGQLGDGGGGRRSTPGPVTGSRKLAVISAGFHHSCGIAADGTAYCWGQNSGGQLGDGGSSDRTEPTVVVGDLRFNAISTGVSHTCGLTPGGPLYCWGSNNNGQLGDGTRASRSTPGQVTGSFSFRELTVGWSHTCALSQGNVAYCWGRNAHGQLGDGTGTDRMEPSRVTGVIGLRSLSAGSAHSCGVSVAGRVYCWGQNSYGQLGDGTTQNRASPVRVAGLENVRSIVAGGVHTCALTGDGDALCWGRNTYGQLGDGSTVDRVTPVLVLGGVDFATLYSSGAHTCGTTSTGHSYCWGYNVAGQLGDGTRSNRSRPVQVQNLPG